MIKIGVVRQVDYTTLVQGNGGEEQLVITASWGQDGRSPLVVTSAQVDGGAVVLRSTASRIQEKEFYQELQRVLVKWTHGGIKPSAKESEALMKRIDWVIGKVRKAWDQPAIKGRV